METREAGRGGDVREGETVIRWSAGCLARTGPEGRGAVVKDEPDYENKLNKPYKQKLYKPIKLYDTETRLQRVCGEPCRKFRRSRSTAGDCAVVSRDEAGKSDPR